MLSAFATRVVGAAGQVVHFWTSREVCLEIPWRRAREMRTIANKENTMAPAKIDRRTERTRSALMSAFVAQILTGGYDAVTVEGIAAKANVGRSTFYMHYKSKDDILKQSLKHPSSPLSLIVGHDMRTDMLVPLLLHFQEQRKINGVFFREPIRALWVRALAEMIEPRLAAISGKAGGARPALSLKVIALQIAECQIALIANWLIGKSPSRPEIIAQALIDVTHANMSALLRWKFETPPLIAGERIHVLYAQ
jgi:AcrR family transcriptional regulator